jgi:hypothetical protein
MTLTRYRVCFGVSRWLGLGFLILEFSGPGTHGVETGRRILRPTENEFASVSHSVVALLQSRDTARFAREISPSADDWKSIASTNLPDVAANLNSYAASTDQRRQEAQAAAKAFRARADALHLEFSKGEKGPSRQELDQEISRETHEQAESARSLLGQSVPDREAWRAHSLHH